MSFNGGGDEGKRVAMLLAASFDHRQHRLDETAASIALSPKRRLPPDDRMAQRPIARSVRRLHPLREIRFKLHAYDRKRAFRYILWVSSDGERYTVLMDASRGAWRGWQQIFFSPRPVKTIRLEGLYCNTKPNFAVIEFEAYCIPPMEKRR